MNSLSSISQGHFKLKASLFTLTTFCLLTTQVIQIEQQLKELSQRTPHFFQQLPVILDLSALVQSNQTIEFPAIMRCLRQYGLIPVGVRGGNAQQHLLALQAGLGIFSNTKTEPAYIKEVEPSHNKDVSITPNSTPAFIPAKVITQPVRSGQQIYAKNRDLIVLASVSPGAELLADGNIHIYNRLRGRALAGVNGLHTAHIFCQKLEAELIAIAGHYWLSEDLHDLQKTQEQINVHISLHEERLQIKTM